ncbi:MAG: ribonuclease H-like domain-containing protein [Candidatus Micrarchaeota archaeon]
MPYMIIDVETVPGNQGEYESLESDEQRKKLLNPIDSRIVAIGLKQGLKTTVLFKAPEKELLESFWNEIRLFKKQFPSGQLVGFNIKNFDLPFLVTRSFVNDVEIQPFLLKSVVDLREKLSAFKFGHVRGTLKEFGRFLGIKLSDMDGSMVAQKYWNKELDEIKNYLEKDLDITDAVYQRCKKTRIIEIERW